MSKLMLNDVLERYNEEICIFLFLKKVVKDVKDGRTNLTVYLTDASGELAGKIWNDFYKPDFERLEEKIVKVKGYIELYRGIPQIKVIDMRIAKQNEYDTDDFSPSVDNVDGLTGLQEAISAAYPKAEIQRCIIHQLRNSFKYVSYKDRKEFVKDFKTVYTAVNEEEALENLFNLKEKWDNKYPFAIKSWEANWDILSPFFKFPKDVRRIMYTTNIIESLHRQFRKVTKTKSVFPSDQSLEKILYLASQNIMKKWSRNYKNWDLVLNQLMIFFKDRIQSYVF